METCNPKKVVPTYSIIARVKEQVSFSFNPDPANIIFPENIICTLPYCNIGDQRCRCTINQSLSIQCKKADLKPLHIFSGHWLNFVLPVSDKICHSPFKK